MGTVRFTWKPHVLSFFTGKQGFYEEGVHGVYSFMKSHFNWVGQKVCSGFFYKFFPLNKLFGQTDI